jgi:hypothetical protein
MRGLIIFLLGAVVGACALRYYQRQEAASRPDLVAQWHLTPDEIRDDLARTGEVARSRLQGAGSRIADARIVAVIKAKYLLDRDLSAVSITVQARDGKVVLGGSIPSTALVGRAVALALDTDGVSDVVAHIAVQPPG